MTTSRKPKAYCSYAQSKAALTNTVGGVEHHQRTKLTNSQAKPTVCWNFSKRNRGRIKGHSNKHSVGPPLKWDKPITEIELREGLNQIDRSKRAELDGTHPIIVKPLEKTLVEPFTQLSSASLNETRLSGGDGWCRESYQFLTAKTIIVVAAINR